MKALKYPKFPLSIFPDGQWDNSSASSPNEDFVFANTFEIETVRLFPQFKSINEFVGKNNLIYENIKFNKLLYDIIYDKTKDSNIFKFNDIKNYLNDKVNEQNIQFSLIKLFEKNITYKDFIKKIFKNHNYIKFLNMSLPTNIYNCHYIYNASEYLLDNNIINVKSMVSIYSMFNKEINLDINDDAKIDFDRENIVKNWIYSKFLIFI